MTAILQHGQILPDSGAAMTDDAGHVSERFSPFKMRQQIIAASQKHQQRSNSSPGDNSRDCSHL
jgi:hypothetical protein